MNSFLLLLVVVLVAVIAFGVIASSKASGKRNAASLDDASAQLLFNMRQSGDLSKKTLLNEIKRRGIALDVRPIANQQSS